jgi:hypothetical protein
MVSGEVVRFDELRVERVAAIIVEGSCGSEVGNQESEAGDHRRR